MTEADREALARRSPIIFDPAYDLELMKAALASAKRRAIRFRQGFYSNIHDSGTVTGKERLHQSRYRERVQPAKGKGRMPRW